MPENKSYLDTFSDKKPESYNQETFVAVQNKSRRLKIILTIVVAAVLLAGTWTVVSLMNNVRVPKLVGMTLDEANAWATKNRIILAAKNTYDFAAASGLVIAQEVESGKSVQKNTAMTISVSLGADPSEKITWPDIASMKTKEIEAWISSNKLTGVKIVTANSDVVAADQVISYSLTDDTEANFIRKSRATVTVSIGPATKSATVVVSDFSAMKTGAILQWGNDNGIAITLTDAFDDYIAAGSVLSQSIKAATEIKRTESITVVISKGKPILVPDMAALTQTEASTWAKQNGVTLTIQEKYASENNKGKLLSQGIAAGTSIKTGDEIKLTYSLGLIDVASFIGKTKLDILSWQNDVNAKGAALSLAFSEAYGEKGTAGKIISQSVKSDQVSPGAKISVVISLGKRLLTPDFSGKTEAECNTLGQSLGLTILFSYQSSSTVSKGLAISQSPAKDTVTTDANPVTVVISVSGTAEETVTVPDFAAMKTGAIQQWCADNGIAVEITEVYNSYVSAGSVISANVTKNQVIRKSTLITVTISKGPAPIMVTIPDLRTMTKDEANAWAKANNITLSVVEKYHNTLVKGSLFDQSTAAGESVAQGSGLTVQYSLGQVEMISFIGKTKLDMMNWLTEVNRKGGNITAAYTYAGNKTMAMNTIIGQSIMNTTIETGTTVTFNISWDPVMNP